MNDNRLNDEYNEGYKAEHRVLNDPKCGIRPTANRRVIDGTDAGFGTFPWQALIRIGKAKVRFYLHYSVWVRDDVVSVEEFSSTVST